MIKNKTISNIIISRDIRRMHMMKNIDSRLIENKRGDKMLTGNKGDGVFDFFTVTDGLNLCPRV